MAHVLRSGRVITRDGAARRDRAEYRLLVMLAFSLCLGLALARRIHAALRGAGNIRPAGESVFAEARASAHAAVGYAFMG